MASISAGETLRQALAPLFDQVPPRILATTLAVASCVAISGCAATTTSSYDERSALLAAIEQAESNATSHYRFAREDILSIPDSAVIDTFSLQETVRPPILNPLERTRMLETIQAIEEQGACSLLFVDLQSGLGISHNAGAEVYTASCAKAVLGYYALMKTREQGDELPAATKASIAASIQSSSNEAFEAFSSPYMTDEYNDWLEQHGVRADYAQYGPYLNTSAKGLASLWAEMHAYLESDDEDAAWLARLLGDTNRSFIRDGVESTGAKTWNKGGWIDGEEVDSTSDAGLIELDGRTYLMVILTGQPSTGISQQRVAHLAKLLFEQRETLQ